MNTHAALRPVAILLILVLFLHKHNIALVGNASVHDAPQRINTSASLTRLSASQRVSCMIIVRDRLGQLGHRLFLFASALGLALTHSCYLNISAEIVNELNQLFELDLNDVRQYATPNHSEPHRQIYNYCSHLTSVFPSNTFRVVELKGYWQVHNYFAPHDIEVRRQLRFKWALLDRANHFLENNARSHHFTRVGIHVRAVSSDRFVRDAMSYFTGKYRSVRFVIVTDDRAYCRRVFGTRKDVLFTPTSFDAATDLATLTQCEHAIITVGTFGWWGAFLLRNRTGEVLTDAKPDFTPVDNGCDGRLYFPPWFSFLNKTT